MAALLPFIPYWRKLVSALRSERRGSTFDPWVGNRGEPVKHKDEIIRLLQEKFSYSQIAKITGCSKSTVAFHARRLRRGVVGRCATRYDWEAVRAYVAEGHRLDEVIQHFGLSRSTWSQAVKRGDVPGYGKEKRSLEEITSASSPVKRQHVRRRLLSLGILREACYECGLTDWRGKPLTLQLDHINGVNNDNREENLRLLCPNCHSQTETWGNKRRP